MSTEYAGDAVDLVPGTLRGYRVWQPCPGPDGTGQLASLSMSYVWEAAEVSGECLRNGYNGGFGGFSFGQRMQRPAPIHPVPHRECSCGIYARHTPDGTYRAHVSGVIEGWGRVEVGSAGFRAAKAKIIALAMPDCIEKSEYAEFMRVLQGRYPVQFFPTTEAMWKALPPIDISALLPPKAQPPADSNLSWVNSWLPRWNE